MSRMVIGVFDDYERAAEAVEKLKPSGFKAEQISLVGRSVEELRPLVSEMSDQHADKLITRFAIFGAIGGALAGIATIVIPGLGAMVIAGPLLAAFSGAAAGTALGVVAGALAHFDIPEDEAKIYEGHLSAGKVLVAVHTSQQQERVTAEEIFDTAGAIEVDSKAA
jgi:hypothetical protein